MSLDNKDKTVKEDPKVPLNVKLTNHLENIGDDSEGAKKKVVEALKALAGKDKGRRL